VIPLNYRNNYFDTIGCVDQIFCEGLALRPVPHWGTGGARGGQKILKNLKKYFPIQNFSNPRARKIFLVHEIIPPGKI